MNKNNDFIQQFVSLTSPYSTILESHICKQRMYADINLNVNSLSAYIRCLWMWYSPKWCYRGTLRRWIVDWSSIFVFFVHKKYSRSFVKLRLNRWWIILTMSSLRFWALIVLLSMKGQRALWVHQKYLNLCSEDERRSYGLDTREIY